MSEQNKHLSDEPETIASGNAKEDQKLAGASEIKSDKQARKQASELMGQLGVNVIYYTSDGYWFTQKELAEQHARAGKVDVKEFKS